MIPLKIQAIQTALQGDWNAAVTLNQMVLEEDPTDIDAMNRLAFAKASLGSLKEAKSIYQKVLVIDATNPIAQKNLHRLNGSTGIPVSSLHVNNVFIEEPGKTKVVELINIADKKVISPLRNGEHLSLSVKRMKIFVHDGQKQYIGMLPDDIGNRLIKFIDGGNQYEAYVKTVSSSKVIILIKEVKRALKFKNQPSFISIEKSKLTFDAKGINKQRRENKQSKEFDDDTNTTDYADDADESL
jgi:hypothetical protein